MFIHEAVELSLKNGKHMRRKEWVMKNGWQEFRILPTNSPDRCIPSLLVYGNEVSRSRNWNPSADDLIADDWELAN